MMREVNQDLNSPARYKEIESLESKLDLKLS